MNGPEHYREAEGALAAVKETSVAEAKALLVGIAQVHATLALVAAQVDLIGDMDEVYDAQRTWQKVTNP